MSKWNLQNHIIGKVYDLTQENMNAMISDIEYMESGFVHTCHDDCQKPICVKFREKDAEIERLNIKINFSKDRFKESMHDCADILKLEEIKKQGDKATNELVDSLIDCQNFRSKQVDALEEKLCVAREALKKARQFCTWLSVDSLKYPGTDAGMAGKHEGQDIDKALEKLDAK